MGGRRPTARSLRPIMKVKTKKKIKLSSNIKLEPERKTINHHLCTSKIKMMADKNKMELAGDNQSWNTTFIVLRKKHLFSLTDYEKKTCIMKPFKNGVNGNVLLFEVHSWVIARCFIIFIRTMLPLINKSLIYFRNCG